MGAPKSCLNMQKAFSDLLYWCMAKDQTTEAGERTQLSKWWMTPSAQAAFARVADKRKEEARKTAEYFRARDAAKAAEIAKLDKEIWKEVE